MACEKELVADEGYQYLRKFQNSKIIAVCAS